MQNNLIDKNIWLVGSGYMGKEYARVLKGQGKKFSVIGRGNDSAKSFEDRFSMPVFIGGLEKALEMESKCPEYAIVAVGVDQLLNSCLRLIEFGVKNILVEKPAGLNSREIKEMCDKAKDNNSKVFVAYNRRFYSSTLKAQEIIKEDGGVTSFNFEFTEWSHKIKTLTKLQEVLDAWFLANSTHVIDLAFFLGGTPKEMSCYISGATDWYTKASTFSGAGITNDNALFSYQANWEGPGRWGVELITRKHRLIFKPMEKLQIQEIGSIEINGVDISDELDHQYKPGLYLQVKSFLEKDDNNLLRIEEHYNRTLIFEHIEDGENFKLD